MINIINTSRDPYFNLALEEYALTAMDPAQKYCILWQNDPAVIVGRNQNTAGEINEEFINARGIKVVRRLTGGGAVYHDPGNLNFTFVTPERWLQTFNFPRFTRPVIRALSLLGVEARDKGRNDITIKGRKISGNAQCRHRGRLMHHGTLLFSTDLDIMGNALSAGQDKFESHGVASMRSRVTNIGEHLPGVTSLIEFRRVLLVSINEEEAVTDYCLSPYDLEQVNHLRKVKYSNWAWNYGNSPLFNVQVGKRFAWGKVDFRLGVEKGIVISCCIRGDFFALREMEELEHHFLSRTYSTDEMVGALNDIDVGEYITGAVRQEFVELFRQGNGQEGCD